MHGNIARRTALIQPDLFQLAAARPRPWMLFPTGVVSTLAFVDTVQIYFRRLHPDAASIPSELFSEVVASNKGGGGRVFPQPNAWGAMLVVQLPTRDTLSLLKGYRPSRLHIAYDWMMAEQVGCIDMRQWFLEHLILLRRRLKAGEIKHYKNTVYWQWRGGRNLALYIDKPSKLFVEPLPCAHLDFRLQKPAMVRKAGIYHVGRLLEESFNPARFLSDAIELRHYPKGVTCDEVELIRRTQGGYAQRVKETFPRLPYRYMTPYVLQLPPKLSFAGN